MFNVEEKEFIKFLQYYSNFYLPAYKVAENKYGKSILNHKKGKNKFQLYALDEICKSCSSFKQNGINFTPKTTDGIWYKKDKNQFNIYIIEFKGDKLTNKSNKCILLKHLNDLKRREKEAYEFDKIQIRQDINIISTIISKYSDKMLNGLAIKPLETVTIAIPLIYREYCNKNNDILHIDIVEFLRKSKIIYRVVSLNKSDNPSKNRANAYRYSNLIPDECDDSNDLEISKSYENNLKSYYKRYQKAGIIDDYDFIDVISFNNFINNTLKWH